MRIFFSFYKPHIIRMKKFHKIIDSHLTRNYFLNANMDFYNTLPLSQYERKKSGTLKCIKQNHRKYYVRWLSQTHLIPTHAFVQTKEQQSSCPVVNLHAVKLLAHV